MGETLETRKGQNLETIISKLSKEQPAGKRDSYLLISGIDHTSLMFHVGASGHNEAQSEEDDEPDIFQCGRCRQMYTNLQKYLKHKSSRECRQKSATHSTVTSPGFSDPGNIEFGEENNFVQSPPKRKHDRKGIARRVSNVPESDPASDPPSPDIPVVVPDHRPFAIVSHAGPPGLTPVCSVVNGIPSPIPRSVNQAFGSRVPPLKSPTERGPVYSRPEVPQQRGPSMASPHPYTLPFVTSQPSPVHHVIINNPMPPSHLLPAHGWPRPTIAVDPHFTNDKEPSMGAAHTSLQVRGDGKMPRRSEHSTPLPQPQPQQPPPQAVPLDSSGQPVVVHLKERGRPIRPKETGLTEEELTQEIITSSGQKIFKCKKCEKEFSFSSRLKRHLLVHTGARPFECPICFRRFTQAVDLKRHMLRHSGQKPHVCQYCGKQYTRGDRLKVHLLSHTEGGPLANHALVPKPYNCSRCSMTFEDAEELYVHTCDFNQDGSKPLDIDVKGEDSNSQLNDEDSLDSTGRYEGKAKAYRCDECHSTFTKSTSLKSHLLKHTGEKKFKCAHCPKTFFSSSSLKIHVRVHTGDRPFKCKECPRKFSDPSNFNKHKRWHAKQAAHGGFGNYTMHVLKTPETGQVVGHEGDSPPDKKLCVEADSPSERGQSVDESSENTGAPTPEGSDSLFQEEDDEDEDISVDDDDSQVASFASPEVLVGMTENSRQTSEPEEPEPVPHEEESKPGQEGAKENGEESDNVLVKEEKMES
ncbi:zinc finger protein 768-like isoform X2 [Nematostella vectensis]|uniref:zinc finger protein 768-like isoform X2 n=1 Tax=Nematostella vectensis TaxID=45351 RepID=UPI002076EC5D|nr:zinc finger protein 768-like isoform X2 [Nematostella vectensis]